ncbi:MAG: hemolysin family protein [Acidobacteria bacterium]|nr:hemolysin family protein [Acidobacteriota bacterium]MCA1637746.1 hemolysin family protein [Acidobacteriota bacterium]
MEIEIVSAIVILFILVFLATVDMAFSQISDVGLRRLSSDFESSTRVKSIAFLQGILENRPRFRFALSTTIQILLIAFSVLVTVIIYRFYPAHFELLFISLTVGLVASIIFRQLIPRLLTWKNPEGKLLFLLPVVRPFYGLLSTVADPFQFFTRDNSPIETTIVPHQTVEEEREDNTEDIQALIEMGEAEGILEEKERELIETMVEFSDTRVVEIMTPRTEICALSIDSTVRAARDLIIEEKYSRVPVYRETIDNIEGVIYVRDLLNAWAEGKEDSRIENLLRSAYFVPETKSAAELLKNMQLNHVQVAVVVDEYGGVAGLVTVEDILEEIVGEIEDEDTEDEEIVEIIEGMDKSYYDVLGSTEIGKIERLFSLEIEDDDFRTIAGLVTSEAGYIPKIGEKLNIRGLDVEILRADEKRISLLRLRPNNAETNAETHETTA